MRVRHVLVCGLCWTILGCSTVRVAHSQTVQHSSGFILVLEDAVFDGHSIEGRLLIGSSKGQKKLDPASWPIQGVNVHSAKKCDSPGELPLYARDGGRIASENGSSFISLAPGDWYGRNVNVLVSAEEEMVLKCVVIEATLPFNATDQPGGEIRFSIRAERGDHVALMQPL